MIRKILGNLTTKGKGMLVIAIVFFVLYALAGTAIMLVVLDMIRKIIDGQSVTLGYYWLALAGLVVFKAVCNVIADMSKHFAGFDVVEQIRSKIILSLKRFSLGFYTKERLGEISTIIHKDVDNMEGVVGHMWTRMSADFITAFILGVGLFILDWRLGLAMISLLPAAFFVLLHGSKSGQENQQRSQDDLADMVSLFVEYVKGIPLLKAFHESGNFQKKLEKSTGRFGRSSKASAKSTAGYLGWYALLLELCFAILSTLGAWLVFRSELSVFTYLMVVIVSREFYKPFAGMEGHWLNYIKVTDSYKRILSVLDAPVVDSPKYPRKADMFDIEFDKVDFFYKKGEFELRSADFRLEEGTLTALVGPSGSGKTTVTNLLLRFWEPQAGTIRIGGVKIQALDYDELLEHISIVMQNVILFADTIYNNIVIGNRNASREEVIEAAKKAMIHDFITGLPEGYDTPMGENGVGLSGGQKQRISIARAFLKNSPIVILDEMTSNVDPVNEAKIQQAISNLSVDRTVLVIAHHLRTIRNADKILVLEDGRIVQEGTHNSLIVQQTSLYRKLWQSQEEARNWQVAAC
jgi:ATP-binding cassette, subfamily B, bacterial IrtB/YbtQ